MPQRQETLVFKQLAICFSGQHFYSLIDPSLTAAPLACCAAHYHDRHPPINNSSAKPGQLKLFRDKHIAA
jgi:hypothetical protein